jgi:DNA-binding NarL/FixJ family response regulator
MSQLPLLRLLLIDDDAIFRMGLRAACASWDEIEVTAEAETTEAALAMITAETANSQNQDNCLNIIVLELATAHLTATLPQYRSMGMGGVEFCQQLKAEYPQIPILLFTTIQQPILLSAAQQAGVEGYCLKGIKIEEFITAVRQVAAGNLYWNKTEINQKIPIQSTETLSIVGKLRYNLYRSGVQQIDAALAKLSPFLRETPQLSNGDPQIILNWLLVTGRRRELRAARWMISQLLPETIKAEIRQKNPSPPLSQSSEIEENTAIILQKDSNLAAQTQTVLSSELKSNLFDTTVAKLQSKIDNKTNIPLEVDLLKSSHKKELFLLVLQQFERILDELKLSGSQPQQLPEKTTIILRDIWEASTLDFFGKYYEVTEGDRIFEVIPILLRDAPQIQIEILEKIPLVPDLIAHFLYQIPLKIDNISCSVGSPEAMIRAEALLHNLVIQVANAVIQPLINYFADFEEIKEKYYHRKYLSTREIEKFRNDLSWKYRIEKLVKEPTSIFESSYNIWVFGEIGIQQKVIYSPRKSELELLSGIPLAVTLALESRDAVAPRVRATVAFLGSGVVYVLTQVIGRGIGLIGKGVLQGIGSSLQDSQTPRKKDRQ